MRCGKTVSAMLIVVCAIYFLRIPVVIIALRKLLTQLIFSSPYRIFIYTKTPITTAMITIINVQ